MPVKTLTEFLDDNKVKYVTIRHSTAYTAQQIAESAHIPGDQLAKTVMVKLDDRLAMAVLRGTDKVDVELLRGAAGAKKAELATEVQFQGTFPGVELGAMPPFGNLYDMPVYVDEGLTLIATLPDYESIVIDADGRIFYSDGLRPPGAEQLTD